MIKTIKSPRKGVTIIELVIALSVIFIITVAAISIIHSAIKIEVRAASIIEANNTAESIVEIFRYSKDSDDFLELGGLLDNSFSVYSDNENEKIYEITRGAYYIDIKCYYTKVIVNIENEDVEKYLGYKIEIDAYHEDGTQIYNETITFIKGQ